jgi:NADPH:quinone reductase-like Zn-dependent oxidoreductase
MSHPAGLDFLVNKGDRKQHRCDDAPVPDLADGQILFRVDRFAFTANNISYALAGESLRYWDFFPAPEGWGRLPTMGYADVIESKHAEVAVGTRCFGFYPMSRYLVIEPSAVSEAGITDSATHREGIAPFYNQYNPTTGDALHHIDHEDALMLMRGLFMTAYLADDFPADRGFGEQVVLISSASSKTSIALAHCVSKGGQASCVGITSTRNQEFVRKLGCYDQVVTYEEIGLLDASPPAVFVDMAGSSALQRDIHEHFGDQLKHSCSIGATHWEAREPSDGSLPGPRPEFFFAPG